MKNKEFDMDVIRRHELLYTLLNRSDSIDDHIIRIRFEIKAKDVDALMGAMVDFFIRTTKDEAMLRRDMLKETMHLLDTDWLLLFYDHLDKPFMPTTAIPYNHWSLLTENVQGRFDCIENPYIE